MVEISVQGNVYRIGKLDAFKQLHLSRKLAPLIPQLLPAFIAIEKAMKAETAGADDVPTGSTLEKVASVADSLGPFADALAGMTDADTEYVVSVCLGVVQRQQGATWAAVWNAAGKVPMFSDMDLGAIMPLTVRTIQENLGNFIRAILTGPQDPAAAAPAQ